MLQNEYQNFKLNIDDERIVWLSIDKKDASTNTLDLAMFNELGMILHALAQMQDIKGLVIQSGKSSGFVAGADIEQFTKLESEEAAFELVRRGQMIFDQLEALPFTKVALIDGFCLGGGLEMVLACDYRIAEDSKTRLGLPEVMLGIHPGWGGSVRLPRKIGALKAMDLILSGRTVQAKVAKAMGFVDMVQPRRYLVKAARDYIVNKPDSLHPNSLEKLTNKALVRPLIAKILRKKLKQKIKQSQYPAPFAVVDYWEKAGVEGEKAYLAEAHSLAKLQMNATAKNLVRVFFLQNRLKALGKTAKTSIHHVHVIGAGTMGGDIAAWAALSGFHVTLQDSDAAAIGRTIKRAFSLFKGKLKDRLKVQAVMDRLLPDMEGRGIAQADVIIEAIFEHLETKQNLFKNLEGKAKPDAILATNTSSIPLDQMNQLMQNPSRLVGIHFFNPVSKMMLVEVVCGASTAQGVFDQALSFVRNLDKLPLPTKSSPGFLVNRVLMPYLMECMACLQDGYSKETIDAAAVQFGMPMGPVQLADTVGLDVCLSVAKNLTAQYGGTVPDALVTLVNEKKLGVKSGHGLYIYKNGKPVKDKTLIKSTDFDVVSKRMIYRLLNEGAACLREGVVSDADLVDAGMIFATGFAPFRGGPIHYAKSLGKETLLAEFAALQTQFGDRFAADSFWSTIFS